MEKKKSCQARERERERGLRNVEPGESENLSLCLWKMRGKPEALFMTTHWTTLMTLMLLPATLFACVGFSPQPLKVLPYRFSQVGGGSTLSPTALPLPLPLPLPQSAFLVFHVCPDLEYICNSFVRCQLMCVRVPPASLSVCVCLSAFSQLFQLSPGFAGWSAPHWCRYIYLYIFVVMTNLVCKKREERWNKNNTKIFCHVWLLRGGKSALALTCCKHLSLENNLFGKSADLRGEWALKI